MHMILSVNQYNQYNKRKYCAREPKNSKTISNKLKRKLKMQEMNELNAARAEHIAEKMTNQQFSDKFTVDSVFITDQLLTKINTQINTSHK